MDIEHPHRVQQPEKPSCDDPMRGIYLAALDGDDDLARLVLAYLTVVADPITDEI